MQSVSHWHLDRKIEIWNFTFCLSFEREKVGGWLQLLPCLGTSLPLPCLIWSIYKKTSQKKIVARKIIFRHWKKRLHQTRLRTTKQNSDWRYIVQSMTLTILTCCQHPNHILRENIWFVWSKTSYSGNERWCYRCGTYNQQQTISEDRATQPMQMPMLEAEFRNWTSTQRWPNSVLMTEYEYEYHSASQKFQNTNIVRLSKNDRIRIRILFGFPKMT